MKKLVTIFALVAICCVVAYCLLLHARHSLPQADESEIKANYAAFRDAVIAGDLGKAKNYLSASYLERFAVERVLFTFSDITNSIAKLTGDAHVSMGGNAVFFFPRGMVHGADGYGFVKESNGWKLNGSFAPVSD